MSKRILPDKDNWLAAEYALGVLNKDDTARAQAKYDNETAFRHTVDDWHTQFEPFLDDVEEILPNKAVWKNIETVVNGNANVTSPDQTGIWKLMTALTSTLAVAAIGALMFVTGGDFTGQRIKGLENELASAQTTIENTQQQYTQVNDQLTLSQATLAETQQQLSTANDEITVRLSELSNTREELSNTQNDLAAVQTTVQNIEQQYSQATDQLASSQNELVQSQNQLAAARAEISEIRRSIAESQPLVASLTQSGDAPSFVAQFDPLKGALLIRTAIEDTTEKVPEIWLIPSGGERNGEVLSLGVMNENAPDEVKLTNEFIPLVTEGGTLAITMEPPGGAPNGVATGPIIALGKLQALN